MIVLTHLFCVLWYKNIQLIVFWNDKDINSSLFSSLLSLSGLFFLWSAFFFLCITHTLPNKSVGNIFHLHFSLYSQNRVLFLPNKNKASLLCVAFCFYFCYACVGFNLVFRYFPPSFPSIFFIYGVSDIVPNWLIHFQRFFMLDFKGHVLVCFVCFEIFTYLWECDK